MHPFLLAFAVAANSTGINLNPAATTDLPGESVLSNLASGVAHWALLASILGVVVGGVMWAFGHFSHNYQQSYNGRKGVLVSGLAALLIGGAQEIIGFFFTAGQNVH
jgi:MFS family permease